MSLAKVPKERSGLPVEPKDGPVRPSQRPVSQLSSLLAGKGLDRSSGSLRALEQRRSAPVPVSQKDNRRANAVSKCEGYATDSSEESQYPMESQPITAMSPSLRIPERRAQEKKPSEERSGLAASLEGAESTQGFVPPHKMSMPANGPGCFSELSSKPGSLYEGVGRKLRGLDAVRFRQSVMRQTGFLEPAEQCS